MEVAKRLREVCSEIALLESTSALLEWDERTGLPSQAGHFRAEQVTLLSGMIHRKKTAPEFGDLIDEMASADLSGVADGSRLMGCVRRLKKEFERNTKLPNDLVEAASKATVLGQQAWEHARAGNDWSAFQPHLEEIFNLRRQEAELLKTSEGTHYDALLDQYEEGASSEELTGIFARLRDQLVQLVGELKQSNNPPTGESLRRPVDVQHQREISRWVAEQIGYSFERGRLDETSHPFCTTLGPDDCRILTRYQKDFFPSGFYGTLHEAGHGLYEQGLPGDWFGTPAGTYCSLGVHESQSRLWENFVGRSQAFWQWAFEKVAAQTGGVWSGVSAEDVFRDANYVEPSLIRVEADEVTYNLHILIRFEIEQQLLHRELLPADAPAAWKERYQHYLGIDPPNDADGILQDVHWSAGLIGYFPTYALGNLYAAQLMEAATESLGNVDELVRNGEFTPLLSWLQEQVHSHGACLEPRELIAQASGQELSEMPLVRYLRKKLTTVYQL